MTRWAVIVACAAVIVVACAETDPTAGVVARPEPASTTTEVASYGPPTEPAGTVVIGGVTHELSGRSLILTDDGAEAADGDFGLCDVGRSDQVSVVVAIGDDEFALRVRDGVPELRFGEAFVSDDVTTSVDFTVDGRTVRGSATLPVAGTATFEFRCP